MRRVCKKVRKKLPAFLNYQLEVKKAKEVEQHLDTCSLCKREAEELRLTWNLLDRDKIDEDFPDLLNGILERIEREGERIPLFHLFIEKVTRIPAPALCLIIFLIAIPPGAFLGKNLYLTLSSSYPHYQREAQSVYSEEIPLDIFDDFPGQSLGNVYLNVITESSEEEL